MVLVRPTCVIEVNFDRLRQELEWYVEAQEGGRDAVLERIAKDAHTTARTLRRLLNDGDTVSSDLAERVLLAIEYRDGPRRHPTLGRCLPLVIRSRYIEDGRRRQPGEKGRIKKVDFANAKLTERQLRAVYRLHMEGGLSLREIARRGWETWGYANANAALNSLSDRLRSMGLKPRSRTEATAEANRLRGNRLPGETKNEYRRRIRAHLRATDPEFRRDELERIAFLRAREGREAPRDVAA